MRIASKTGIIILGILLLTVPLLGIWGCDGDDNGTIEETGKGEIRTITIGSLTDMTGVAANSLQVIDIALQDMVNYYNDNNLIPGVELEVEKYDTQYDPTRFTTGYEWLRQKGADVIWNALPPGVPTLMSRVNTDQFPFFTATANVEPSELDGSYVFCLAITPTYEAYTFLDWLAKNDPDFPKDRPAKIGGAAWTDGYNNILFKAAKEYCKAHPDQYDWVTDYITNIKFTWMTEAEGLKDCDYVFVPTPPQAFMKQYRAAGYSATFLGTELPAAFMGMMDQEGLGEAIDGMYFLLSNAWYNESDIIMDRLNTLLDTKHSAKEAEEFRANGCGYRGGKQAYMMCEIIKETVERVGIDNFNSETCVDTAKSWSFDLGDVENFQSFTETKRFSQNYYAAYEVEYPGVETPIWKTMRRAHEGWIPQVTAP
jgi:hypothetical protein